MLPGHVARSRPDWSKVKLPLGVLGWHGTDFEVSAAPDKSGYVKLFSGFLDFTATADGAKLTLKAGQMLTFDSESKITGPTPIERGQ